MDCGDVSLSVVGCAGTAWGTEAPRQSTVGHAANRCQCETPVYCRRVALALSTLPHRGIGDLLAASCRLTLRASIQHSRHRVSHASDAEPAKTCVNRSPPGIISFNQRGSGGSHAVEAVENRHDLSGWHDSTSCRNTTLRMRGALVEVSGPLRTLDNVRTM